MRKTVILFAIALAAAFPLAAKPIGNYCDAEGRPFLSPPVRNFTPTAAKFALPARVAVAVPQGSESLVALLDRALKARWPERGAVPAPAGTPAAVRFTVSPDSSKSPEGYTLAINGDGIAAAASTPRGLYYAAQTLCNMIANVPGPELPGAEIADWPDLALRGVYLRLRDLKPDEVERFCRTIDAFGSFKYNTLLLEFADNFPYRENPFTLRKFTLSKEDVARIVAAAERNHMEIVPFLQVLTHDAWLQTHPKYWSEIAEGKTAIPWRCASCPSKPLPRELNTMAIREQIEFFRPRIFMINMDEISLCPWRVCPECRKRNSVELWSEATRFYTDFTLKCGAAPMLAHDCFYPGNDAFADGWRALEKVDRRTLICNWDYDKIPRSRTFDFFKEQGFTVVGMSYCEIPDNVMNLPRAVKERGLAGVVLTYWHYLWRFSQLRRASAEGFAATCLAGVYQWKCDAPDLAKLPYDPAFETRRRFTPEQCTEIRPGAPAAAIPLDGVFNRLLGTDPNFPRFGAETAAKLRREAAALPEKFDFPAVRDGYAAVVLSGGNDDYSDREAVIPIGMKAAKFSLLMTGGLPGAGVPKHPLVRPEIAKLTICWADGRTQVIPFFFRRQLTDWNSPVSGAGCRFALRGNDASGAEFAFYAVDVVNPHPETAVAEIRLATLKKCGFAPALLALSAIGADRAPAPEPAPARREHIVCGFDNGLGPARISTEKSKFAGKVTHRIFDDPTSPAKGKVLEITVPPTAEPYRRNRVCVDIPLAAGAISDLRSITFDCFFETPEFIDAPAFYLMDNNRNGLILYDFNRNSDDCGIWRRIVCPIVRMKKERAGIAPAAAARIRLSFFMRYHDKPCRIRLARIGFTDAAPREAPPLRHDPED